MWSLVLVLVILWSLVEGQGCVSDPPCLTYDYVPCSASEQSLINSSNPNPVHVILTTQETTGWQNVVFKSILMLLCVEYRPSEPSNQTAPYCWSATTPSIVPASCNLTCNCTAIDLWVFETSSQSVVSPLRVADVLNQEKSKLALHFAGFTLLNVSTDEGTGNTAGVALFEVPLLSWICVGLGMVASLLVLSTPVWWDRLIVGLCLKWCRSVKLRPERSGQQLDSEET